MSKTVLVIDDETQIVEICRDYLTAAGFAVLTAADGVQGLAVARRERPDLIVLDLMLPRMDGLDVCRELRRDSAGLGAVPGLNQVIKEEKEAGRIPEAFQAHEILLDRFAKEAAGSVNRRFGTGCE